MMESAGLVYPVPDAATMNAIPSPKLGMVVERLDLGGVYMYHDGTGWKDSGITQSFAEVNTSDANWTYDGGLYRDKSGLLGAGDKRVQLSLVLKRTAASFNITTAYTQAFSGLIPAGFRPNGYSATCYSILQNANGDDVWGVYVRVDKSGHLAIRTDQGSNTVATGHQLPVNMSWLIA